MLGEIAAHPGLTIPVAVVIALGLIWYWRRLADEKTPASRRNIRRCSILFILLALPILVAGLSFFDPQLDQQAWIIAWAVVIFIMMLIIASALVDAINNLNLHREEKRQALTKAAAEMIVAVRKAREEDASPTSSAEDAAAPADAEDKDREP
ncbi:MAG: hypothetical protein JSV91_13320 [Phycisphaerales bacterium]|nr:MAG: hypothetical protein JSV91_13320 [Phycisphaerales bacterium]